MNKTVVVEYTEEDKRLLSQVTNSPDDPCENCSMRGTGGCCGCPEQRAYDAFWKPYKDAEIEDVAKRLLERENLKKVIQNAEYKIHHLNLTLPDFVGGTGKTNVSYVGETVSEATSGVSSFLKMAEGNK